MTRPRRLYKDSKGRYFYIVNNQQKFVKVPKDMAEKDVVKISLKTLENLINKRRVKRKKKRPDYKYEKAIVKGAPEAEPVASKLVVEGRKITQIEDIVKNTKQKKAEQLAENVESFFDALSKKRDTLKSGTKLVEGDKKGVKQGKEADKAPKKPLTDEEALDISKRFIAGQPVSDEEKKRLNEYRKNKKDKTSQKPSEEPPSPPEEPPAPTPPAEPKPPAKPASEQIRNIKKAIRKPRDTSGLMPSLRTPAKTTEQKLAETPSFSGTTTGTEAPAAPLSTAPTSSPIPEGIVEKIRKEIAEEEEARKLMGLGDGDDGLYNDEIANLIRKRVGRVVPVIPSDKVKYLKDYVKRGDKIFAAVINTNPSDSDGSGTDGYKVGHWRAIFIDNEDDYPSIEYFDPLVSSPEKELQVELKKIAKKMNPERMFLYKENRLQRQAKEASTCGYHAAQFIDDRFLGIPFSEASGYDDFINSMGTADHSADGEAEIKKYIKKYKIYI